MAASANRDVPRRRMGPRIGRWLPTGRPDGVLVRFLLLCTIFVGAVCFGYLRQVPPASVFAGGVKPPATGDPRMALFNAAADVESRLRPGQPGLAFTATQLQLLRPAPGGPDLMLQPDRDHPDRVPTPVKQIVLGSLSGRGAATNSSFFAEWFTGTDINGFPAFEGDPAYVALVHEGKLWRRDDRSDSVGLGWLAAPDIPGFGVDPMSLRELPDLLRRLRDTAYLGIDADGHHWRGTSDAVWYPGAVAVDGASFTDPEIAVEVWLDDADRLVGLFAVARNANETTYQLLCVDRIRFDYAKRDLAVPTQPAKLP